MDERRPEILLLAGNKTAPSDLIDFFERRGCRCCAGTLSTARQLAQTHAFDFMISMIPLRQDDPFVVTLSESDCSIFYRLSVEDGCWWVPLGGKGRKSLGSPALRCAEFTPFLEKALDGLKSHEPAAGNSAQRPDREGDRASSVIAAGGGQ